MQQFKIVHGSRRRGLPKFVEAELIESDENCQIMHEPIADVELAFMPKTLRPERPECCGLRLACGHIFASSSILYHWARNRTVLCPVCRQGLHKAWLNMRALPPHIAQPLMRKVTEERAHDRQEQIAADYALALREQGLVCSMIFESYDGRCMLLQSYLNNGLFHIPFIDPVREFLGTLFRYRIRAMVNNYIFPPTPWVQNDQSWVWVGPAGSIGYQVIAQHGQILHVIAFQC